MQFEAFGLERPMPSTGPIVWPSFDDARNDEAEPAPTPARSADDPEALFQEEIRRKRPEGFAAPVDHRGETAPLRIHPAARVGKEPDDAEGLILGRLMKPLGTGRRISDEYTTTERPKMDQAFSAPQCWRSTPATRAPNSAEGPAATAPEHVRPAISSTKFTHPDVTATGERRASVSLKALKTLWFNTGTLCNLACENCYIESSPRNDRLIHLSRSEVDCFLAEAAKLDPPPNEIGFTGGEPFMNPDILGMLEDGLAAGFAVLVLTNAMKPMQRLKAPLLDLNRRFPGKLALRVSLDHYGPSGHERLRGPQSWRPTIDGLLWLAQSGFFVSVAGRTVWQETDAQIRAGYAALFDRLGVGIDAANPARLVLFPEMRSDDDVPEITERCWSILGKTPDAVMCASSRMIVKRKGADKPAVLSCTLLPYDAAFELGASLAEAARPVKLNHRYCARFCVLGGASCSG